MKKKLKKIIACILLVSILIVPSNFGITSEAVNSTDKKYVSLVQSYLGVIIDAFKVAIDYFNLQMNTNTVSKDELVDLMKEIKDENIHPFVLADSSDFDVIRKEYFDASNVSNTKQMAYSTVNFANKLIDTPLLEYTLDEEDAILEISRECISRMIALGFAWQITGEEKYAERAWQELDNVCHFQDWCNSHFLDTAEMALAVSIGYDWCYDYLSAEQKAFLCESVWKYAVEPARSAKHFTNWFVWSKNNWNSICYSGIGIACMTFGYYNVDSASRFLRMCYKNMPIAFEYFTPDGVYAEGSGYWESGTSSLVYFIETSGNFFGTDFGLSDIKGFKELGTFPLDVYTPSGVFNYGDNKDRRPFAPVLHWYASKYNEPLLSDYQKAGEVPCKDEDMTYDKAKKFALSALWYNRKFDTVDIASKVPLCVHLNSDAGEELCVMRSSFLDENATYAAIKGGYNYTNHGDLDIGTFMFDSMGVRWTEELGPGRYDAPNYFVGLPGFGRWKNYCKRAEGQNTLVINPKLSTDDQYTLARCGFSSFKETDGGAVATLNMTDAYRHSFVNNVERDFELFDNKTSLRISDTVNCKIKSEIYWFMHTKAEIDISDNGKIAYLSLDGKTLKAELKADGEFSVTDAVALKGKYEYDYDYPEIKKLTVHLDGVRNADIVVELTPVVQ